MLWEHFKKNLFILHIHNYTEYNVQGNSLSELSVYVIKSPKANCIMEKHEENHLYHK